MEARKIQGCLNLKDISSLYNWEVKLLVNVSLCGFKRFTSISGCSIYV